MLQVMCNFQIFCVCWLVVRGKRFTTSSLDIFAKLATYYLFRDHLQEDSVLKKLKWEAMKNYLTCVHVCRRFAHVSRY